MKPTTEQIIDWGRKALNETGALIPTEWNTVLLEAICSAAYEAGAAAEREACAQIAHDTYEGFGVNAQGVDFVKQRIIEAIRARGQS